MTEYAVPADLTDAIAVIGLAGRFPGARNVDEYWRNIAAGVESIAFLDDTDFPGVDPALLRHPQYVRAKGILDDIECFDAGFFGYTPPEARAMDPQHRIFLECGWTALEDAGYEPESYPGAIGVYAGLSFNSYAVMNLANPEVSGSLGTDKDFLSTRLSYKLNLKGPSIVVQTACSTSLVAVCQACQALLAYQCDIALAGGVSATVPRKIGYWYQEGGILSPDGHCRAFDAKANGTVPGNGVGIVVLKRLPEAIQAGDSIRAVIRGFAVNNDGALKIGYTAPSIQGQAQVIATAQGLAGVEPDTISYLEAHGTGTDLGDPIEIAALTQAFRLRTDKRGFCAIGSVKTNIGHLDTAAGIAGLIKTVLALERKQIPPTLHFDEPNPKIALDTSPFYVNTRLLDWRSGPTPRRAGVSSFGIGGTNAHVVLEEAPALSAPAGSDGWHVLTVSARTDSALDVSAEQLAEHLGINRGLEPADVAYTLHVGRKSFPHRRAILCRTLEETRLALESNDRTRVLTAAVHRSDPQLVFMFPGQGAQYSGMGRELYRTERVFRTHVDECSERIGSLLGTDPREVILAADEDATGRLGGTVLTQAALFAVEYALAQLWMAWGVKPAAFIGHSVGEYVAACLAGVLPLDDAMNLVAVRGALMEAAPEGAMLAVAVGEDRLIEKLPAGLSVAAVNGPGMCVVAGDLASVEAFETQLRDEAVTYQRLRTAGAFHSRLMDGVIGPLVDAARNVRLGRPRIPYISDVTGSWMRDADALDPAYWGRHARMPVRFGAGVEALVRWGAGVFLEVGPGQTLTTLLRMQDSGTPAGTRPTAVCSLRSSHEGTPDDESIANAVARLWLAGIAPDWGAYHADRPGRRLRLPTYPFERKRYWAEPPAQPVARSAAVAAASPVAVTRGVSFAIPSWSRSFAAPLRDARAATPQRFLVCLDPLQHGWFADCLARRGHDIVRVVAGNGFRRIGDAEFVVDPAKRDDYVSLLIELAESNRLPDRVLHLWQLTGATDTAPTEHAAAEVLGRGFFSLLRFVQAWTDLQPTRELGITVVADAVHDVTGIDDLSPEKATLLGPCRVLPQENSRLAIGMIDVGVRDLHASSPVVNRLLAELESPALAPLVALRGVDRLEPALQPVALGPVERPAILRDRGVYLITGGYGAIGLSIARYLAGTVKARLALVGRSGLPERDRWQRHLSIYKVDDEVSRAIRAIEQLEELGGEVLIARADTANEHQLRAVVAQITARWGPIDGVIHSAGVPGGGVAQLRDDAAIAAVMRPKFAGTRVLDRVFSETPLDFMVVCSSLTGLVGGIGQVDYCAANAYLDAFARERTRRGELTIAIDWDTWRDAGMAVRAQVPEHAADEHAASLARGLDTAEGIDAFARTLASELPQVVVARATLTDTAHAPESDHDRSGARGSADESQLNPRPNLTTTFVDPQDEVQRRICDVWQEALGIERIGVHDSFFDLGGHSLHAIQVVARLNGEFGTAIPVARLYEGLTPAFLAEVIRGANGRRGAEAVPINMRGDRRARQKEHSERRVAKFRQGRVAQ
jgi:acyl transferase domain-containing protein